MSLLDVKKEQTKCQSKSQKWEGRLIICDL